MLHSTWLRNLLNVHFSRNDRRRAERGRKSVRLILESLEERLTPSGAQTAGSYADLANAIAADTGSNTNYDIQITSSFQFDMGKQVSIAQLGSGSTLTIEGQNGTNYTLTGNGNRLFAVASGQDVTFKNLTLTGGTVQGNSSGIAQGGALLDAGGSVTLSRVAVQNNSVLGPTAEGGGICVTNGGTLTIKGGSTIQSNSASNATASVGRQFPNISAGGGLYVYGPSKVTISDSTLHNNSANGGRGYSGTSAGMAGGVGAQARGGGLYVAGVNWNVTLQGDTLSGNRVIGGDGGSGAAGGNATGSNRSGGTGGAGGAAQEADGGGAYFAVRNDSGTGSGSGTLTISNDAANPSRIVNNSVQAGSGGSGGAGGTSTGAAANSNGGKGGQGGAVLGGGLIFYTFGNTLNVNISNTTLYGNSLLGGNGGSGGAAGTGSSGAAGTPGSNGNGSGGIGGGIALEGGNVTVVNSTFAKNTITGGTGNSGSQGGMGGGIDVGAPNSVILDNNTITQNVLNGTGGFGAGIALRAGTPTLLNNLIQGNQAASSSGNDVDSYLPTLSNATDNFVGTMSAKAVNTTTNIVGNSQTQLGSVVGVDALGSPSGGPIYYPLLPGVVSIGAGTTSDLSTIASVEGTSAANATDEIGSPRSSIGSIDLGAVQFKSSGTAPTITTNPTNQTVTAGGSVSFTAAASGTPAPTVQWQVSTDSGLTFRNISGATSAKLTFPNAGQAMNGQAFRAVFTNNVGSAISNAATLTVQTGPVITTPDHAAFTVGQGGSFTAAATGSPMPTLTVSGALPSGITYRDNGNGTGTFSGVAAEGTQGTYHLTIAAQNGVGSGVTQNFTLTIDAAPTPTPTQPPTLHTPPLLGLINEFLSGVETVNADGGVTVTYSLFGFTLIAADFDSSGNFISGSIFGIRIPNLIWFI